MGDMGDDFRAWDAEKKAKKQSNIEKSTDILTTRGWAFETKNGGVHLIVRNNGKIADFWPSTGKYNIRGEQEYKRGVFNLMKDLEQE